MQIAERRDGRNVILEHIGTAHDDAELALLMATARNKIYPPQDMLDIEVDVSKADGSKHRPGVITGKQCALLWHVLSTVYDRLGFNVIRDEAFKQMVLARLIEPTSKEDSLYVLEELGIPHVGRRTLFRSLQRCQERDYRSQLAAACYSHARTEGDLTLCLYDVTTLYFEAEKEDTPAGPNKGLRRVGYSKERRVDPQIVVGLLVDRRGFPLDISCWEGNRSEKHTILPVIESFQARHQVKDIIVVADAGMLSEANFTALDEAGVRFIVGSTIKKAPGDLESHFAWHGDAFKDGQIVDTITPRGGHKPKKKTKNNDDPGRAPDPNINNPKIRAEPVWDPDVHTKSWRAIWVYSAKRFARDNRTLTAQENRARAVVAGERAAKTPRFVKTDSKGATLDEESLTKARQMAGLKGYVTNVPVTLMPPGEIVKAYHDLWHVEQSFRMSKTDLRARPIFHHTRDAIESHLTIVMAALTITRYLHEYTGMSLKRTIRSLRRIQSITVHIAGHEHAATDPLSNEANHIIDTLGIKWE